MYPFGYLNARLQEMRYGLSILSLFQLTAKSFEGPHCLYVESRFFHRKIRVLLVYQEEISGGLSRL